jgi:hypothetical protein
MQVHHRLMRASLMHLQLQLQFSIHQQALMVMKSMTITMKRSCVRLRSMHGSACLMMLICHQA